MEPMTVKVMAKKKKKWPNNNNEVGAYDAITVCSILSSLCVMPSSIWHSSMNSQIMFCMKFGRQRSELLHQDTDMN
jgi:hypothetical protein